MWPQSMQRCRVNITKPESWKLSESALAVLVLISSVSVFVLQDWSRESSLYEFRSKLSRLLSSHLSSCLIPLLNPTGLRSSRSNAGSSRGIPQGVQVAAHTDLTGEERRDLLWDQSHAFSSSSPHHSGVMLGPRWAFEQFEPSPRMIIWFDLIFLGHFLFFSFFYFTLLYFTFCLVLFWGNCVVGHQQVWNWKRFQKTNWKRWFGSFRL